MSPEHAEEFTQSLAQIGAGWWRQRVLAIELGVPEALGQSIEEWARSLGAGVKLAIPERREAVQMLRGEPEDGGLDLTTREAAAVLGISIGTVFRDQQPVPNGTADSTAPDEAEALAVPNGTTVQDEHPEAGEVAEGAEEPEPEEPEDDEDEDEPELQPAAPMTNGTQEPTMGDLTPPDLELPSTKKPRPHEAVFALLKLHGYTDVAADDLGAAALEVADVTHEPRLYDVHLQQVRETAAWLTAAAEAMAERMGGARLRVLH